MNKPQSPEQEVESVKIEQPIMNHQQALDAAKPLGVELLDAQLLLLHALGRSPRERAWLLAHDDDQMLQDEQDQYVALLQRRAIGVPVAYLTGEKEFYSLSFSVDRRVLVPRPETETLVDLASHYIAQSLEQAPTSDLKVLDLGTGSGIVAIALKFLHPTTQVTAIDQSADALAVAKLNALGLLPAKQSIEFLQGSWFSPLNAEKFSLIVSNPPYIAESDHHLAALEHEPIEALTSGQDGLDAIRKIISQAALFLLPEGCLMLEHGYDQAEVVQNLLKQAGFNHVQTQQDLAGVDRVTSGVWLA